MFRALTHAIDFCFEVLMESRIKAVCHILYVQRYATHSTAPHILKMPNDDDKWSNESDVRIVSLPGSAKLNLINLPLMM